MERLPAVCWVFGGAIWVGHVLVLAARPEGCIADGCRSAGASVRITEDLLWLFLVALAALGLGMAYASAGRGKGQRQRRGGGAVRLATGLVLAGAATCVLGLVVNAVLPGDSPIWWLHDSDSLGRFLPVLGSALGGVAAWRGRWLRRWQGALLVVTALASLGFNAQTDRILFALPLGVAWVVVGASELFRHRARANQSSASSATSSGASSVMKWDASST